MNKLKIISLEKTIDLTNGRPFYFYSKDGKKLNIEDYDEFAGYSAKACRTHLLYHIDGKMDDISNVFYLDMDISMSFIKKIENGTVERLLDEATTIVNSNIRRHLEVIKDKPKNLYEVNNKIAKYGINVDKRLEEHDIFTSLNLIFILGGVGTTKLPAVLSMAMKCAINVSFWDQIFYSIVKENKKGLLHLWGNLHYLDAISTFPDFKIRNDGSIINSIISKPPRKSKNDGFKEKITGLVHQTVKTNPGLTATKFNRLLLESDEYIAIESKYAKQGIELSETELKKHIRKQRKFLTSNG